MTHQEVNQPGNLPDRPLVTLAWAQSLDGSIARKSGERLAISGPEATAMTHALRAEHDTILVGIGTVLADDPRLDVRLAPGPSPLPLVLDPTLRTPADSRLVARTDRKPWLFA
ncbi:MAG: RibD family protein, partial [Victivallales bacterium]|nr:RibD family protein [Victivallales bacterium]